MGNNSSFLGKIATIAFRNGITELIFPLQKYTNTKNHQAISRLAPKTGIIIGIMFLLHHLFWSKFSVPGLIAALLGSAALCIGVIFLLNTIATIICEQEKPKKETYNNTTNEATTN